MAEHGAGAGGQRGGEEPRPGRRTGVADEEHAAVHGVEATDPPPVRDRLAREPERLGLPRGRQPVLARGQRGPEPVNGCARRGRWRKDVLLAA